MNQLQIYQKRSILPICLIAFCVQTMFTQVIMQEKVRSSANELLLGVTASVNGIAKGTVTDENVKYSKF